jgi:hypothetical protein
MAQAGSRIDEISVGLSRLCGTIIIESAFHENEVSVS